MRPLFVLLPALSLAGCSALVETDQARLCRMAAPALEPPGAVITIVKQTAFADGRGLRVDYRSSQVGAPAQARFLECRFRQPGRPRRSEDLVAVTTSDGPLPEARLAMLIRYWLATPEARAADPAPLGDVAALPAVPAAFAYALQQAINGLPLAAIYALLAAAYSLVYGLVGRINLAFGDIAAAGGYAAALGATLAAGQAPATILATALVFGAANAGFWGVASSRWVFQPLHRASGQQTLIASIGLALALGEFLRLSQGNRPNWVSPLLNAPFGVARAGDFIVTTAPNTLLAGAFALVAGLALVLVMQKTRFGRRWRAYADDPLGAQLFGVSPRAIFGQTFALASAFAGLSGFVMTMYYGSVGYGTATALGLKALIAAILGGVGSIPGAFLGGFIVGAFEAAWSTYFAVDYRDVAVFSLLAILLTLRPGGILGAAETPT